jgi:hypothetical protein
MRRRNGRRRYVGEQGGLGVDVGEQNRLVLSTSASLSLWEKLYYDSFIDYPCEAILLVDTWIARIV